VPRTESTDSEVRREIFAGVMSGTSLDGVDAVVADFAASAGGCCETLGAAHVAFPTMLRDELLALQTPGANELARAGAAANMLAELYGDAIARALADARLARDQVTAAGVHGQTLRHRPERGWTLQLNNAARVAERADMTIVADFRSRDVAAGGQGAPLVPAFHAALFGRPDRHRVIVNVGGIANMTDLPPGGAVSGFDTGPGNVLSDQWCARNRGDPYDAQGAWAATGRVDPALLKVLLDEPFFAAPPPKSTHRDKFNVAWLKERLAAASWKGESENVQATLVALTARTIADAIRAHAAGATEVLVCGGGGKNATLMKMLAQELAPRKVGTTADEGVPVEHVEALAFAWLAREALAGRPGNLPAVTGAAGPRILGAIYPR
jgi:anhydro-N-acetylmuramic acid kinase